MLPSYVMHYRIDRKVVSVENHGSLQVERHIQTIGNFLKKHLNQFGKDWVRFVSTTSYAYNSFSSPYLGNYSPYELALGKPPPNLTGISWNPMQGLTQTHEEYVEHMKKKFANIGKVILSLQEKHQEAQRLAAAHKLDKMPIYSVGQLVYLYKPTASSLTANSKKISAQWCGPLVIHEILDRTHYILATLKGDILTDVFSFNRLKPCFVTYLEGKPITHLQKLKAALNKDGEQPTTESRKLEVVDENGDRPKTVDNQQVYCIIQSKEINLDGYFQYVEENQGLAACVQLTAEQINKQLSVVMQAPVEDIFEIAKGRMKAGQLELLLKYNDQKGQGQNFWWKVYNEQGTENALRQIVQDRKINIKGSVDRFEFFFFGLRCRPLPSSFAAFDVSLSRIFFRPLSAFDVSLSRIFFGLCRPLMSAFLEFF